MERITIGKVFASNYFEDEAKRDILIEFEYQDLDEEDNDGDFYWISATYFEETDNFHIEINARFFNPRYDFNCREIAAIEKLAREHLEYLKKNNKEKEDF